MTAPQRHFKGIWIPAEVWLDKRLTYFECLLLSEIHSLNGPNGCYASNQYLCDFFNERERKIQDGLAKLKKLGYIHQESFDGRTRILRTNMIPDSDKSLFSTSEVRENINDKSLFSTPEMSKIDTPSIYNKEHKKVVVVGEGGENPLPFDQDKTFTRDDLYYQAVKVRQDWTTDEIENAWKIYEKIAYPISDPFAYIEGIIKKARITKTIQDNQKEQNQEAIQGSQNGQRQQTNQKKKEKYSCRTIHSQEITNCQTKQPQKNAEPLTGKSDKPNEPSLENDTSEHPLAKFISQPISKERWDHICRIRGIF